MRFVLFVFLDLPSLKCYELCLDPMVLREQLLALTLGQLIPVLQLWKANRPK